MDAFVRKQLRSCACDRYIPLFRDKGYNEAKFRQLRVLELANLLPEDPDAVDAIYAKVLLKRMNQHNRSDCPVVVVKAEPEAVVQVQVKQETPSADASPAGQLNPQELPTAVKIEIGGSDVQTAEGAPRPPTNLIESKQGEPKRRRFSRIRAIDDESDDDEEANPSQRPSEAESGPPINLTTPRFHLRRANTMRGVSGAGERFNGQINLQDLILRRPRLVDMTLTYEFSSVDQLSDLLRALVVVTCDGRLAPGCITILELTAAANSSFLVSNSVLEQLTKLSTGFLKQLHALRLVFPLDSAIDPTLLTKLLERCPKLSEFHMKHGLYGPHQPQLMPRFTIPSLPLLKVFKWAEDTVLATREYTRAPQVVQVDVDAEERAEAPSCPIVFVVDFSSTAFPTLVALFTGVQIHVEFGAIVQFPAVKTFAVHGVASPWTTAATVTMALATNVVTLDMAADVTDIRVFQHLPSYCPRLKKLVLDFPRTAVLRAAIRSLAATRVTSLTINTRHEFQSDFGAALLGHVCTELSREDKEKLYKLQKYKHWKPFMEHLQIELPETETETEPAGGGTPNGLGALTTIKRLRIHHVGQAIHLPIGDLHWSNPDVRVSPRRWSYTEPPLQREVLFEIAKLKKTLIVCNLTGFKTDAEDGHDWQRAMRFKLVEPSGCHGDNDGDSGGHIQGQGSRGMDEAQGEDESSGQPQQQLRRIPIDVVNCFRLKAKAEGQN